MKKSELDAILKKARAPQPPDEFWDEFPQQVARQLNRLPVKNRRAQLNWFPRLAWTLMTAACVLIAFALGHWHGRMQTETNPAADVLANAKLIHETLATFPNQVRAIVEDNGGIHIVLSDSNNVPASTPLYVHICDGKNCSSLVTFSGQEIQVAGQKMTVLGDSHGGIILMGNDFVWSSDEKISSDKGLKIEAKSLSVAAL
jgi:hypothetical protein